MLRVHSLRLAWRNAEELRVEHAYIFQNSTRVDILSRILRGVIASLSLFCPEAHDRVLAGH